MANFNSVDDNGWVYLNGTLLATNIGWNVPFSANLTSAWNAGGSNVLTVLVQNTGGAGGTVFGSDFQRLPEQGHLEQLGAAGRPR